MSRRWNDWKSSWNEADEWQYPYEEKKSEWKEAKKFAAAALLFVSLYGFKLTEPYTGIQISASLQRVLTEQTDFYAYIEAVKERLPGWDIGAFQRAQAVISRPADPLSYMSAPVDGEVIVQFGWHTDEKSGREYLMEGIEYQTADDAEVRACCVGKVKAIAETKQKGKMMILEHAGAIETVYGYLGEILVVEGQRVTQGQEIAKSGKSGKNGKTESSRVYFEVREKGVAINPLQKLS